jgi:hypothetical protein
MVSISSARKSKGRGRPRIDATPINVRLAPDITEALDTYRLEQQPPINRAAAIRQFVVEALKRRKLIR